MYEVNDEHDGIICTVLISWERICDAFHKRLENILEERRDDILGNVAEYLNVNANDETGDSEDSVIERCADDWLYSLKE